MNTVHQILWLMAMNQPFGALAMTVMVKLKAKNVYQ